MSTANRKARKRSGAAFVPKPAKIPTPLLERSFFAQLVAFAAGTRFAGKLVPRSIKKRAAALKARGIVESSK